MLWTEKATFKAKTLKLKNSLLHGSEIMRDFLKAYVLEANETATEECRPGNWGSSDVTGSW